MAPKSSKVGTLLQISLAAPVFRGLSLSGAHTTRSLRPIAYQSQIVVEKLTKNVNESHLREIFGAYGPIQELDMPMNRQCE